MEQQVKMSVGALKQFHEVWEMAGVVLIQIRTVAREVLDTPRGSDNDKYPAQQSLAETEYDDISSAGFEAPVSIERNNDSWFDDFFNQEVAT